MRVDQAKLRPGVVQAIPQPMTVGFDPVRESRLAGMAEGIVNTVGEQNLLEQRISDLRQASRNTVAFRQSLWLLCRVQGIDPMRRAELMRRAMAWWRARAICDGKNATPWAKSMVAIAAAQAGKLD